MAEKLYHVDGHNDGGYFVSRNFETEKDAMEFFGSDAEWQDVCVAVEIFEKDSRRVEVIHDYVSNESKFSGGRT